jgi:peptidoglycan/LPS O-acetylase OafA/YrhL
MRSHQLTFTRFIACFVVIVSHFGFNEHNEIVFPLNLIPRNGVFAYGGLAVLYFFILSGFVLYISNKKKFTDYSFKRVKTFWIMRIVRIYPVYLLSVFLLLFLAYRGFTHFDLGKWEYFQNFTLLQSWYDGAFITEPKMINGASWSLSVELMFYLLCPLYFFLIDFKIGRAIFLIVPLYFVFSDLPLIRENNWYLLLMYNLFFVVGLLAGYYINTFRAILEKVNYAYSVLFLIAGTASMLILSMFFNVSSWHRAIFILPSFIAIVLGVSSIKTPLLSLYNSKIFLKLGNISYTMFLFQAPVYQYLKLRYLSEFTFTSRFWISFVVLTILSFFIYELFENPVRNKVKKLMKI